MDTSVKWNGKMQFTGTAPSGHEIVLDAAPSVGGENKGFRPLELMALSLAGCTAMDVISILQKKRQDVTAFEVKVEADQAGEHPHVFTHITITYLVTGKAVDAKAVERSIELSSTRYCPASAMLEKSVEIEHAYEIFEGE